MDYEQLKILITQYDTERLITKLPPNGTAFLEAQSDVGPNLTRTPSTTSGSGNGNSTAIRKFKTVSALAQHLESGACIGGEASFWEAIKYMDARLPNMGMPFRLTQGKET
ncbi:hypothetical protein BM221_001325 [Beauveria bassiana]|uniref:Uncharacterized protein n=1 Tax=Beauveria bassiana TaxID=176275 RepID=A0A2N6P2Z1_BEABA|nr:hypothetical protein BM221_001325 [Beauveria bassiana]